MSEFCLISVKQCTAIMTVAGVGLSIFAMLAGLGRHVFGILYGTLAGISYYLLLNSQYQSGLRTSAQQAVMNVNNGLFSRVCVVVAFVLFGAHFGNIHMIAILAGLFIPMRLVIIWQVISIACNSDLDKETPTYCSGRGTATKSVRKERSL